MANQGCSITLIVQESHHSFCGRSKLSPFAENFVRPVSTPRLQKMAHIILGIQGENVRIGFCINISVCKLQDREYLISCVVFGKNLLPTRAMERDS